MKQEYNKYTSVDFDVWKILFESQLLLVKNKACSEFLKGVETPAIQKGKNRQF